MLNFKFSSFDDPKKNVIKYYGYILIRRVWRYQRGNRNPYIAEEQTKLWSIKYVYTYIMFPFCTSDVVTVGKYNINQTQIYW